MTRYEKQEQIYQDIQSVEAELDGCPRGSSRWFELHDRLHVLLQAYVAVPQDPPAECSNSLRKFSQGKSCWKNWHETFRMFLVPLWILVIVHFVTIPMVENISRYYPMFMFMEIVGMILSFALAVCASCPIKE